MNIIEVMRMPIGTKFTADLFPDNIFEIIIQSDEKVLEWDFTNKPKLPYRRPVILDNVITEAIFTIVND